ncbi:hypothetical protein D9758_017955 [Tetrapyrgos nigripes]|uniref:WAP domain-containing protein n=1 Tax=Tetrapyrgos nigripes TaxID=182062 RepID=A0A8H5BTP0_9AGAR|nr:hypothetical protein D9758_017955 [Tetrapyrgos nigripes]
MQLKLNRIFVAVSVMLITVIGPSAAQNCQTFDDCPGSDVCCRLGAGGTCIALNKCVNVGDDGFDSPLPEGAIEENARLEPGNGMAWENHFFSVVKVYHDCVL